LIANFFTGNLTGFSIYASTCHGEFSPFPENPSPYHSDAGGIGPWWAQLYAKMSMATGKCPVQETAKSSLT